MLVYILLRLKVLSYIYKVHRSILFIDHDLLKIENAKLLIYLLFYVDFKYIEYPLQDKGASFKKNMKIMV